MKKVPAKTGSKPARHRVAHQITLSPEATKILEKWVDRAGEGTKSIHIDMAIRFAERSGIFDGDLLGAGVTLGPQKKSTIEQAIVEHLPSLLARLVDNANKHANGGG